ncbi:MAG: hypothetical protein PUA85_06700 [Oscillospiraceae bacterium]|nr:hypothetical protein [Oscillospiraceae bacterium]
MKRDKQENKKKFRPLRYIAVGGTFILVIILVLCLNSVINKQIAEKESKLLTLQNEIEIQEMQNAELDKVLNYSDEEYLEYVLSKAHDDLGYIRQGERVFEIVSGN